MFIEEMTPFWWGVYRYVILASLLTFPLAILEIRHIVRQLKKGCPDAEYR